MKVRQNGVRFGVQLASFSILLWLFLRQNFTTANQPLFSWITWLDPWVGLATLFSLKVSWLLVLTLLAVAVAFSWGRLFCGWICPVGFLLDIVSRLKKLLRWKDWHPTGKVKTVMEVVRWSVFGMCAGLVLFGKEIALAFNPLMLWPRELSGILVGGSWPWTLTVLLGLGLVFFPRIWCRFVCPTGSLLGLIYRSRGLNRKVTDQCRHCGLCITKCPIQNIDGTVSFGDDCLNCGQCTAGCPSKALTEGVRSKNATDPGRRTFLLSSGAGLGAAVLGMILPRSISVTKTLSPALLRPPGSLDESGLAGTCLRCGQCIQVCPSKVLEPAGFEAGIGGLGTPRFNPDKGQCMFCQACGQVCPTDAIVPVTSQTVRIGTAVVDQERCVAWKNGTHCLLCVETCTAFAISSDAHNRPVIDPKLCIGCGACEANCTLDQPAIHVTNQGEVRRKS
ncbi:MAG TPA: 4Fe-4S binding protein [Bacillota bacterium]|nr:4Fe-4S binding protein [Bacillota bacterium]